MEGKACKLGHKAADRNDKEMKSNKCSDPSTFYSVHGMVPPIFRMGLPFSVILFWKYTYILIQRYECKSHKIDNDETS